MLGTIGLFPLQLSSPGCLSTTFCLDTCKYHKITKIAEIAKTRSPRLLRSLGLLRSLSNLSNVSVLGDLSDFVVFTGVHLSCISPLFAITDNQFGFKPKHGTDLCTLLLKQPVSYYVTKDTPVFSAFLDASKAFDRINHKLLFAKIIKRNAPVLCA